MDKRTVAIGHYEKPLESVRRVVDLSHGLDHLPRKANVFIKPNIVFWTRTTPFPKWGVITTSRVVEDMVILLKERGIDEITIVEGITTYDPKDTETPAHAFETLGYNILKKRYGVRVLNIFERPFRKIDLGADVVFNFNEDILQSVPSGVITSSAGTHASGCSAIHEVGAAMAAWIAPEQTSAAMLRVHRPPTMAAESTRSHQAAG